MGDQDSGRLLQGVQRCHAAIRPNLHDQAIIVRQLTNTGLVNPEVDAPNWAEDRIHRQHADRHTPTILRGEITAPSLHRELEVQSRVLRVDREEVEIGIQDLDLRRRDDVSRRILSCPIDAQRHVLRAFPHHGEPDLLQLEDNLDDVLTHPRHCRELVGNVRDPYCSDRGPLQRGQQHTAQGVTQCDAVSPFQRANDISPILLRVDIHLHLRQDRCG